MDFHLTVLPGDGVGPEVCDEAIKVLEVVGKKYKHKFNLNYGHLGGIAIDDEGVAISEETVDMCKLGDVVLLGAVGGPKWDDPLAEVRPEDGLLLRTKPVSGGNAISVFKFSGEPQLATVRGKVFEPAEAVDGKGEIVDMAPEIDESMIKVESLEIVKEDVVALDKADVVVAGGAGLGDEDGFELIEDLRKVLNKSFGSVMIGCSRVAVDKGWISSDHQVGLTGTLISPDIYVAVGISGAIHHLVGMVHAKKIIAINTDADCNMFKVADYGVVEDYEEVVPALIEKLEDLS